MSTSDETIRLVHQLLANLQLEVSAIRKDNAETKEKISEIEIALAKRVGYGAGIISVTTVLFTAITAAVSYFKPS